MADKRQNYGTGSRFEDSYGYSRAVRVGQQVFVAGIIPRDPDGRVLHPANPYAQAKAAFEMVGEALREAGADLSDVVRTRVFITNIDLAGDVAKAHREIFGAIKPAATIVEVSRLAQRSAVLEVEADAVVAET